VLNLGAAIHVIRLALTELRAIPSNC